MNLKLLFINLFVLSSLTIYSQQWKLYRYDVSGGLGTANYFGNIGGSTTEKNYLGLADFKFLETRPSLNLGIGYKLKKEMKVKLNLNYGYFVGTDVGTFRESEVGHNYSFHTSLFELSGQYEYYFLTEDRRRRSSAMVRRRGQINNFMQFAAYGFAGAGGIYFIPDVKQNDNLPTLPGRTVKSGTGLYSIAFPIGLGVKMSINRKWNVGYELGGRWTLTRYIDGLSTNATRHNDIYYFGTFNITYKIRTSRKGYPMFLRR